MSHVSTNWTMLCESIQHLSPNERLLLIEEVARSLQQTPTADNPAQQKAILDDLRRNLAAMPIRNLDDGLSGRDHDRILYGDRS